MQAVYYDPANPSAGVIAAGFQKAHSKCGTRAQRKAIAAAGNVWHAAAADASSADEIAAAALASADMYGVGDAVLSGLYDAGVGQAVEDATQDEEARSTAYKIASRAEKAAYAAGRGIRDVALAPSRVAMKVLEEGGETVRAPAEALKAGAEAVSETAKASAEASKGFFGALTTAQIVGGGVIGMVMLAVIARK